MLTRETFAGLSATERRELAENLPPLALAYVGDAVYEVFVRLHLLGQGLTRVGHLHGEAVRWVQAPSQARVWNCLKDSLSQQEQDLVRRGRNAQPRHQPRGASPAEYHLSTGLECLVGYLFLTDNFARLEEIFGTVFRSEGLNLTPS